MISIIISSANKELLHKVSKNIADTIGVPYEIIAIDNRSGSKGICEVYNIGTTIAKYDVICYMHEDIEIITQNWGVYVESLFQKSKTLGILGIAGCSYKSIAPSGWVCYGLNNILHYNLIQSFKYVKKPDEHLYSNPRAEKISGVTCIDGVWFCTLKKITLEFPFDEKLLKGFHGYDTDFSLSVNQKYDVKVSYEILLKHFSEGRFEKDWLKAILDISLKWRYALPLNITGLNKKETAIVELKTFKNTISKMVEANYCKDEIVSLVWIFRKSINLKLFIKLYFYIIKIKKT